MGTVRPERVLTLRDQFAAVRPELVAQCVDQRMQTATAGARVVDTAAGLCAAIRTGVDTAAPSSAAVAAGGLPGVERWCSGVGIHRALTNRVFR